MATKFKLNDCVPCIAIHPGEIIKDELDARKKKKNATDYPPVHSIFRYLSAEVQVVKHLPVKVLRTIF